MLALPIAQYPEIAPPTVVVTRRLPGANPEDHRRDGRHAARTADQRRGEHALHVLAGDDRRHLDADCDLHARHQPRHWRRCRCRTAWPGAAAAAGGRAPARRDDIKSSPDITMVVHLTSPDNRYDSLYMRNYAADPDPGRARASAGHGRRAHLRRGRLRHADLARSGQDRRARPHRRRGGAGDPASRTCRSPPAFVGGPPLAQQVAFQLTINTQGRLLDEAEFGDDRDQDGQRRPAHPAARRRARSSWRRRTTPCGPRLDNKPAVADRGLPAPRR